jgi:hypothetical protein
MAGCVPIASVSQFTACPQLAKADAASAAQPSENPAKLASAPPGREAASRGRGLVCAPGGHPTGLPHGALTGGLPGAPRGASPVDCQSDGRRRQRNDGAHSLQRSDSADDPRQHARRAVARVSGQQCHHPAIISAAPWPDDCRWRRLGRGWYARGAGSSAPRATARLYRSR